MSNRQRRWMAAVAVLMLPLLVGFIPGCKYEWVRHEQIQWQWKVGYGAWHDGIKGNGSGGDRTVAEAMADCPGAYEPPGPDEWTYYQALEFYNTNAHSHRCDRPHTDPAKWASQRDWRWIDTHAGSWRGARLEGIAITYYREWWAFEPVSCEAPEWNRPDGYTKSWQGAEKGW